MSLVRKFAQYPTDDRREYERVETALAGKLFVPAEQITVDCQVVNLSAGGAGVHCDAPPPLDAFVVLYIQGFGRFEGVTTRYTSGELGLRFACKEAKRQRLLADLVGFVCDGVLPSARPRRGPRVISTSSCRLTLATGEETCCETIDVSLQGASLRTTVRPPIGGLVHLGKTCGRVVRHHEDGIAIQFLDATEPTNDKANGS
jgi:hypothetical protein